MVDCSILWDISGKGENSGKVEKIDPENQPLNEFLDTQKGKDIREGENDAEGQICGGNDPVLNSRFGRVRVKEVEDALAVYKTYQANIKAGYELQTEITKGVQQGEDIYVLFLKATKIISLMTGNDVFHQIASRSIKEIYKKVQDENPHERTLQRSRERLARCEEQLRYNPHDPDLKKRLQKCKDAVMVDEDIYRRYEDLKNALF